jgi:predicted nucleic acid-binding protein
MDNFVVVDASVWVSWLIASDVNHGASLKWIEQYIAEGGFLVAPELMLVEVAAALSRQTRDAKLAKETVKTLDAANETHIVTIDKALIRTAIDTASDLQLRAGDAMYVAVALQLDIPLVSWDKEQLRKSQGLIVTYAPDEYVFPEETLEENGQT